MVDIAPTYRLSLDSKTLPELNLGAKDVLKLTFQVTEQEGGQYMESESEQIH